MYVLIHVLLINLALWGVVAWQHDALVKDLERLLSIASDLCEICHAKQKVIDELEEKIEHLKQNNIDDADWWKGSE